MGYIDGIHVTINIAYMDPMGFNKDPDKYNLLFLRENYISSFKSQFASNASWNEDSCLYTITHGQHFIILFLALVLERTLSR